MKKTKTRSIPCNRCFGRGVEPDQKAIGAMLRKNRIKAGLTQKLVAERMKLSPSYLFYLESGKKAWSTDLVQKFNNAIKQKKT